MKHIGKIWAMALLLIGGAAGLTGCYVERRYAYGGPYGYVAYDYWYYTLRALSMAIYSA